MAKNKRGGGSVHLRKDGRWEGRIVVGRDQRGYPKTKNCLARTKKECLEKLKALRASCEAPEKQERPMGPGMTFGEWMDFWYRNYCRPGLRPADWRPRSAPPPPRQWPRRTWAAASPWR